MTAPEGQWGKDSPNPFGHFAPGLVAFESAPLFHVNPFRDRGPEIQKEVCLFDNLIWMWYFCTRANFMRKLIHNEKNIVDCFGRNGFYPSSGADQTGAEGIS